MITETAQGMANVLLRGIRSVWIEEEQEKQIEKLSEAFTSMAMAREAVAEANPNTATTNTAREDSHFLGHLAVLLDHQVGPSINDANEEGLRMKEADDRDQELKAAQELVELAQDPDDWHCKLKAAFELVQDKDDWRAPINAVVKCSTASGMVAEIKEAIQYFTATEPDVMYFGGGYFRFRSPGYRNGPAGP